MSAGQPPATSAAAALVDPPQSSLLDLVDHVLNKGVVLKGEVVLGLAGIDLIYLELAALLCAADRVLPVAQRRPATRPAARKPAPLPARKAPARTPAGPRRKPPLAGRKVPALPVPAVRIRDLRLRRRR